LPDLPRIRSALTWEGIEGALASRIVDAWRAQSGVCTKERKQMSSYPVHTLESAPEKSKAALQGLKTNFGIIPNLAATMATSPTLVNGFVAAFGNFHGGSFTGAEKQVLLLTNAIANRCEWAVAFHSTMALGQGVAPSDVQAIRQGRVPVEKKLAAL